MHGVKDKIITDLICIKVPAVLSTSIFIYSVKIKGKQYLSYYHKKKSPKRALGALWGHWTTLLEPEPLYIKLTVLVPYYHDYMNKTGKSRDKERTLKSP